MVVTTHLLSLCRNVIPYYINHAIVLEPFSHFLNDSFTHILLMAGPSFLKFHTIFIP